MQIIAYKYNNSILYLCLILKIFSNFASGEIPDLDKTVNRTSDKVLAIGRKLGTFNMRFLTKLDVLDHLCWRLFIFLFFDGCFTTEKIDTCTRRQQSLMLLPFQGLAKKSQ